MDRISIAKRVGSPIRLPVMADDEFGYRDYMVAHDVSCKVAISDLEKLVKAGLVTQRKVIDPRNGRHVQAFRVSE